ncbi:MAG: hypothetical protein OYI31_08380 [Chloroflexota bacterium]|nr:hypothetical protein [Chloroflexota bacterium]
MQQLFRAKQAEMVACLLSSRQVSHAGEMGSATEENWRELLRAYLPGRYAVEGGFMIDVDGRESQQLDLIIFDRQYSPVLFETGGVLYVPAESVYGVFEVKQELSRRQVKYAGEKIASARHLRRTSVPIVHAGGEYPPKEPSRILGGILTTLSDWNPLFGDPLANSLRSLSEEQRLDIGCVLQHGAFTTDPHGSIPSLTSGQADLSLVTFVFELLGMLQRVGTASAMDYRQWLEGVSST